MPLLGSLALLPGDSLTIPRMALSVGFIRFVSSTNATQATGALTLSPVGLSPTQHASFSLDALWSKNPPRRKNLWVTDTFERRLEAQEAQTTGKRYAVWRSSAETQISSL